MKLSLLPALLLLAAAPTFAQGDPTYTVHGTVFDTVTNQPIPRALVESNDSRLATLTDASGRFTLPIVLPPAADRTVPPEIQLTAVRPGYLPASPEPVDLLSPEIQLRLTPAATLTGQVAAAALEDPTDIGVQLYSRTVSSDGTYVWLPLQTQRTDGHGTFRFTRLPPGDYTIATTPLLPTELYPARTGPAQQYPETFLGGTPSLDGSLKLHLRAGTTARADLQLRLATYYPVTIPLRNKFVQNEIGVEILNIESSTGLPCAYSEPHQACDCWFQPGPHTLIFYSDLKTQSYAQLDLNVPAAPLTTAPVVLSPAAPIPIRVTQQFSHPEQMSEREQQATRPGMLSRKMPLVMIALSNSRTRESSSSGELGEDGKQSMRALPPGTYQAEYGSTHGYVAAITSGSTDLRYQSLVLTGSTAPEPLDVTVRDDGPTLTGTVDFGTTPSPHHPVVMLLPADGARRTAYAFPGAGGTFKIENFVPGDYRVVAFEPTPAMPQLAYRDPEVRALIEAQTPVLHALPNQQLNIAVPLFHLPDDPTP